MILLSAYTLRIFVSKINLLAAGTLYGALSSMLNKGWIAELPARESSRKKEYIITDEGKRTALNELRRLKELAENGQRILKGE